ncbi:MAG: hypothetical protein H0W70_00225 [Actinobacteria bacterium]|nr:hypothetical protein [Actinomycetota bacterium]
MADILGHSPDMLMRIYAHAMPDSLQAVADRIGQRSGGGVGLSQPAADLDADRRS